MPGYFAHGAAHVGRERKELEDCVRVEHLPQGGVVGIVCDGMGGVGGGALAARTAMLALADTFRAQTTPAAPGTIQNALLAAHHAVSQAAHQARMPGMGTTAVIAWCEDQQCHVGWVGDSRMYCWRQGQLVARTTDHTVVAERVARGELTEEQAASDPRAHVLAQALGVGRGVAPQTFAPFRLATGDVILLCSDGLHDCISDAELWSFIAGKSYAEAVPALIDQANARGGHDNIGAALIVAGTARIPKGAGA